MDKTKAKSPEKRRSLSELISQSVIFTFLFRLATLIYNKLGDGFFGYIFTAYDRECTALKESAASCLLGRIDLHGRLVAPLKRIFARAFEESFIFTKLRKAGRRLLACQVRVYGLFLFSFALYAALVYIVKFFLVEGGNSEIDISLIVTLVMMVIASVGLISARCTLADALLGSSAARFFLVEIVGIRRESLEAIGEVDGRLDIAFVMGIIFGIGSWFVSPAMLLIGIGGAIAALLVMISPEFGVLAVISLLPFLPTMVLVAAVLYTTFCFFLKVLRGKRSVKFDLMDTAALAFMALMVAGGLVALSGSSMKPMLVYAAFMLGYFLVVNLIRSREWLVRCITGVVFSGTLVAMYGLYQNFFGKVEQTWQDSDMFSQIEGRVVSTFENPNVLAEYLIMIIPLLFALFIMTEGTKHKLTCGFFIAMAGGCLIYTWSRGAWLGFLIGMLIFMLMYSKKTLAGLLFCTLAIPFLPFVLPESITQRFMSIGNLGDSSTSYRVYIWQGVLKMLGDYSIGGIGIGNDSFRLIYPRYALSGIESAPHAHNLYLQITVELGIFGLLVFLMFLFFYVQSSLTLHVEERRIARLIPAAIMCGILSVLAQGITDYIWYNYRVFLMFWLMLGLGAASRRVIRDTAAEKLF